MKIYVNGLGRERSSKSKVEVSINETNPIGRGATANIYACPSPFDTLVAKIYKDPRRFNQAKIEAMIGAPPDPLFERADGARFPLFAWPTDIAFGQARQPVGYLMPRVSESQSFTLNYFFERVLLDQQQWTIERGLRAKLLIAERISTLLARLHLKKHFVIDFKPQNIKVFRRGFFVTLLDCDSFSIQGGADKPFPATNFSSEYRAPESLKNKIPPNGLYENQDRFALAVVLFQLLNGGIHPFQGIIKDGANFPTTDDKVREGYYPYGLKANPAIAPMKQSIHLCFDDRTRALFDRAFVGPASGRPTARQWSEHFAGFLKDGALQDCRRHPTDSTHTHFARKPCGTCHFEDVVTGTAPSRVDSRDDLVDSRIGRALAGVGKAIAFVAAGCVLFALSAAALIVAAPAIPKDTLFAAALASAAVMLFLGWKLWDRRRRRAALAPAPAPVPQPQQVAQSPNAQSRPGFWKAFGTFTLDLWWPWFLLWCWVASAVGDNYSPGKLTGAFAEFYAPAAAIMAFVPGIAFIWLSWKRRTK